VDAGEQVQELAVVHSPPPGGRQDWPGRLGKL
jgi:hypothetical protein